MGAPAAVRMCYAGLDVLVWPGDGHTWVFTRKGVLRYVQPAAPQPLPEGVGSVQLGHAGYALVQGKSLCLYGANVLRYECFGDFRPSQNVFQRLVKVVGQFSVMEYHKMAAHTGLKVRASPPPPGPAPPSHCCAASLCRSLSAAFGVFLLRVCLPCLSVGHSHSSTPPCRMPQCRMPQCRMPSYCTAMALSAPALFATPPHATALQCRLPQ